mgnify:CR=1 FL=1
MNKYEIIAAVKNSLNIYSFTAEALENLMEAIRAEAIEEAAKVADRHSTCLNDTPNVIAATIRSLK